MKIEEVNHVDCHLYLKLRRNFSEQIIPVTIPFEKPFPNLYRRQGTTIWTTIVSPYRLR